MVFFFFSEALQPDVTNEIHNDGPAVITVLLISLVRDTLIDFYSFFLVVISMQPLEYLSYLIVLRH